MANVACCTYFSRTLTWLLLLVGIILTGYGSPIICYTKNFDSVFDNPCQSDSGRTPPNQAAYRWYEDDRLNGQYVSFSLQLVCLIPLVATFLVRVCQKARTKARKIAECCTLGFVLFITLVCACLEAWYGSGYGRNTVQYGNYTIQYINLGWVIASVILWLAVLLLIADLVLSIRAPTTVAPPPKPKTETEKKKPNFSSLPQSRNPNARPYYGARSPPGRRPPYRPGPPGTGYHEYDPRQNQSYFAGQQPTQQRYYAPPSPEKTGPTRPTDPLPYVYEGSPVRAKRMQQFTTTT